MEAHRRQSDHHNEEEEDWRGKPGVHQYNGSRERGGGWRRGDVLRVVGLSRSSGAWALFLLLSAVQSEIMGVVGHQDCPMDGAGVRLMGDRGREGVGLASRGWGRGPKGGLAGAGGGGGLCLELRGGVGRKGRSATKSQMSDSLGINGGQGSRGPSQQGAAAGSHQPVPGTSPSPGQRDSKEGGEFDVTVDGNFIGDIGGEGVAMGVGNHWGGVDRSAPEGGDGAVQTDVRPCSRPQARRRAPHEGA